MYPLGAQRKRKPDITGHQEWQAAPGAKRTQLCPQRGAVGHRIVAEDDARLPWQGGNCLLWRRQARGIGHQPDGWQGHAFAGRIAACCGAAAFEARREFC